METQTRSLFSLIRPAILVSLWFCLLTGLVYPLVTTGIANLIFPYQAQGSLIAVNGKIIGSELIGQNFTKPEYFHPRPSVTTATDNNGKSVDTPYNAANSVGSNAGPTNAAFLKTVSDRIAAYRQENSLPENTTIPVDAITASGSGLDPDISLANANLQAARIAQVRKIPVAQVQDLIDKNTAGRQLGILGEPRVNVLKLNLALDALKPAN